MTLNTLRLKKGEDRRIRAGHPWIYSNEINTQITPLKNFTPGEEVLVEAHDKTILGVAYINPHSLIAARLFSRHPKHRLNIDFFIDKLKTALALRNYLFTRPCYRWVFSEGDGLPGLILDRFNHHLVAQCNTAGIDAKKQLLAEALLQVAPETTSILLRNDIAIREQEGLPSTIVPLYGSPPEEVLLEENTVSFYAPIWKGQKTGWFYDHRANRLRLKDYVKQKQVLDVFSYLGAWGIQAACFGATHVDFVESSPLAMEYLMKNAKENNIDHKVTAIACDAFETLKTLHQEKRKYDIIILDPPAFIKKSKDRQQGLIAYQRLNELALKLLVPQGILISCSCSMHLSFADLTHLLQRAAFNTHSSLQILERGHQAPDHPIPLAIPEADYLKALIARMSD